MIKKSFEEQMQEIGEWGVVEQVLQTIALVSGIPGARIHELIAFENGAIGEVFLVDRDNVEVLILTKEPIRPGMKVTRTGQSISVPVGPELFGQIIDPLGNPVSNAAGYKRPTEERKIDVRPPSMATRKPIDTPMLTGVMVIDMMMPLGKGQRELIIGDRKTGKSSFLMAALKSQVKLGAVGIYAAIGRKKSDIKIVQDFINKEGIADKIIMVATTSNDSPSLIYQTPYAAMTIAEYMMEQGNDVLLVMDDLSTHGRFYREISLLAKRFPGREAYPGDIFYTHAKLVERAGNYKRKDGTALSITTLPIVEIVEGDFTGYIATNLMGMTDGHIFFDQNVYYKGRRPAVNLPLSVTRVGRQAQTKLMRNINREVTRFLASYEKMQSLAQFGAELTADVRQKIKTGDVLYKLFEQPASMVIPLDVQIILFGMAWTRVFDDHMEHIPSYRQRLIDAYEDADYKAFMQEVVNTVEFEDLISNIEANNESILQICEHEPESTSVTAAHAKETIQQPTAAV
jgi:F-type H+/Na+-transporting ATPase subunit alpha